MSVLYQQSTVGAASPATGAPVRYGLVSDYSMIPWLQQSRYRSVPAPLVPATGSATVSDPRDGVSSVRDPRDGSASAH